MHISLKNISYTYSQKPILSDVHLDIQSWDWIAFYWASGSGKTTLLRIVGTLLRAQSGVYTIDHKTLYSFWLSELRSLRKNRFWYIFSDHHFIENFSARENILLSHTLSHLPIDMKRMEMLVDILDIGEYLDQKVAFLSTGQRERMAVIAGLIHTPDCIIIDEPWSSLHTDMRNTLYTLLEAERARWVIIVSASHDPLLQIHTTQSYSLYDSTLHPVTSLK